MIFAVEIVKPGLTGNNPVTLDKLIKSLLFIPFYSSGDNYFPVLSVGWTLIVEVFVYIFFYFSFLLAELLSNHKKSKAYISVIIYALFITLGWLLRAVFDIHYPVIEVWGSKYQFSFPYNFYLD